MPASWILAAGLVSICVFLLIAGRPRASALIPGTANTTESNGTVASRLANKTSQLALVILVNKFVSYRRNPLNKFPGPFFSAISNVSSLFFHHHCLSHLWRPNLEEG